MSPFEANSGKFPSAQLNTVRSSEEENKQFKRPKHENYAVGDIVPLKVQNTNWRKGALRTFTNEVHKIRRVNKTRYKFLYSVEEMNGEKIVSQFDSHMLSPAVVENVHKISILGRRIRKGKEEIHVHLDGYPQSEDEWIDARQLQK